MLDVFVVYAVCPLVFTIAAMLRVMCEGRKVEIINEFDENHAICNMMFANLLILAYLCRWCLIYSFVTLVVQPRFNAIW